MTEKKLTAEEVEAKLQEIRLKTAEVQLQQAQMQLEQTEEQIATFKAEREGRGRRNKQRQMQLRKEVNDAARAANECTHRQGGSVGKNAPKSGKGPSALSVVLLPDGQSELIMCAICRLRVFSPNRMDKIAKPRGTETPAEMKARVLKYERDLRDFQELRELAKDKMTPEAAAPMDCGVTFSFKDADERDVLVPRPCDSYLQGADNRQGVIAQ